MTDEEVKDFVVKSFGKCFKFSREKSYSKLGKEENLRKVAKLFYTFSTTPDEVKKYVELIEKTPEAKL